MDGTRCNPLRPQEKLLKRGSTIFLQVVVVFIGVGALTFMLWEPHIEGRNANATTFQIYFKDPFLAYAYLGSIAFFVALYQAFKVLGYVSHVESLQFLCVFCLLA